MSPKRRMYCSSKWIRLILLLFCHSVNSAILGNSDDPDTDSDDFGTELNSLEIGIKPGDTVVQYDEEGIWICPQTFHLAFDLDLKPFSINLVRAPGIRSTKIPIYLTSGNTTHIYQRKNTKQYCNYLDIYTTSSFTISLENEQYVLDGTFRKKGKLLGIQPRDFNVKRHKRSAKYAREHSLFLLSEDEGFSEEQVDSPSRKRRQTKQRYEVEILVYIDVSVYNRFKTLSEGATDLEKEEDTVEKIAYRFSHVMNGVNLRYAAITDQDYEIGTQVVRFVVAQTPFGSPWTDINNDKNDIRSVLTQFQYHLQTTFAPLLSNTNYDHAVLFTRKDLSNLAGDRTLPDGILGGSTVAGACSIQKMSVIESKDLFTTIFASAHELAHNLGAYHDGQDNQCDASALFLMTPSRKIRQAWNYRNMYKFSSCSKRELGVGLRTISRTTPCLLQTTVRDQTIIDNHLKTPPGQGYTLDQQCQTLMGPDSYFCGHQGDAEEVCGKMSCWFPGEGCGTYRDQPADQGTTCGDRKWCIDGVCVYNSSAPSIDPNCIFGDSSRPVLENRKCDDVIREFPFACYRARNKNICCASCARVKKENKVGCEYGDKDSSCKSLSALDQFCPQPGIGDLCCETCSGYRNTPLGDGTVRNANNPDNFNNNNRPNNGQNSNVNNQPPSNNNNNQNNGNENDGCGSSWTFNANANMCYRLTSEFRSGLQFSRAQQTCQDMGGILATPQNPQQQRALEDVIRSARVYDSNVWIGLFHPAGAPNTRDISTKRRGWRWTDGRTLGERDWNAWYDSEPTTGDIWVRMRSGRWWATDGVLDANYAICQKRSTSQTPVPSPPQQPPVPVPPRQPPVPQPPPQNDRTVQSPPNNGQNDKCGSGWTYSASAGLCYSLSSRYSSGIRWSAAKEFCESRGGLLATPVRQVQNTAVRSLINDNHADNENVWIGLYHQVGPRGSSLRNRRGGWQWVGGQTYYSNGWTGWESFEPGFGERWVRMRGGSWFAIDAENNGKYAVCQKEAL